MQGRIYDWQAELTYALSESLKDSMVLSTVRTG